MRRTAAVGRSPRVARVVSATERIDPRYDGLDLWPVQDVLSAMWEGQMAAVAAVGPVLGELARAVEASATRLERGRGRLVYVGAGTSGRLAAQDGTELTPTFQWPASRIRFLLAGGTGSLMASAEGAEDDTNDGIRQVDRVRVGTHDVVIGLAASGTTPCTLAAVARAKVRGALTIAVASNTGAPLLAAADHSLFVDTGPEVVAGSTRMKAGTAQKVVLNLLSSAIMTKLGRVHAGIMVETRATNSKLQRRATTIVAHIAECDPKRAAQALAATDGEIKPAVLLARGDCEPPLLHAAD